MFWSPSLGLEACQSCWRRLGDRHLGGVRVAILQRGDVPGALEPAKLLLWVTQDRFSQYPGVSPGCCILSVCSVKSHRNILELLNHGE